jgi:hypothetical protein
MYKKIYALIAFISVSITGFAQYDGRNYLGAELYSTELFRFGRFEARMYMAAQSGTVSSMFLYHNDSYMGAPEPWREVDIEVLGKSPSKFQSNMITGYAGNQVTSEQHHNLPAPSNSGYHTYAMEWTPDYIAWYIDGVEMRRTSNPNAQITDLRDTDLGLRFNLWIASDANWVGSFNPQSLPVHQYINWVKVYDYTPGAGENGSDFTLKWKDDFDRFNTSRWQKGDWTFDGNLVYLTRSNINVKDGTLIISLTSKDAPGFSGTIPADNEGEGEGTGIEKTDASTFDIYPNPTNDVIHIRSKEQATDLSTIRIYTTDGKLVVETDKTEINVSSLESGIYFISAGDDKMKFVKL